MAIIKVDQILLFYCEIKSVVSACVGTPLGKISGTVNTLDVDTSVVFHKVSLPIVRPTNQIAPMIM
jgi:hypothetical protein